MPSYAYETPNSLLVEQLHLLKHPEGGYYAETLRDEHNVPSPYAGDDARNLTTAIYYLLTPDNPIGVIHRNKSLTVHVHHQGRALYTLIRPGKAPGDAPRVRQVVVGPNAAAGEVRQLVVGGDEWKASEIPAEDLKSGDDERVGCLITEVVVPGFDWRDHEYLTKDGLRELFAAAPEELSKYEGRVKKTQ
ncbi:hypothetical protein EXIGLDRAFT_50131 [Exidia glandulosa HHB12029]|uniref:DUF985 domain-containing protein n=1 Tax=Exidia glandulosa HHB12029 TaxID=1314781 RepID=A0A166AMB1_EXIGL|nr:hypothetical protein EXIGLDRAFT_50131 [Exidia glandulosa HHB12029]